METEYENGGDPPGGSIMKSKNMVMNPHQHSIATPISDPASRIFF